LPIKYKFRKNPINAINENGSGQDVKSETDPSSMADNENTPIHEEIIRSPDPKIVNLCDSEWNSDDEQSTAAPDPFSSQTANLMQIKGSPTFDDDEQATPPRFSNTDRQPEEDNLDNMLGASENL